MVGRWGSAPGCRSSAGGVWYQRAADLLHHQGWPQSVLYRSCRWLIRAAGAAARASCRTATVRLSLAVRVAATRGRTFEQELDLSALSDEGVMVRKRRSRCRAIGKRAPILLEAAPNARWWLDFVHDQFVASSAFHEVDDVTRKCLAAIPDISTSGRLVA